MKKYFSLLLISLLTIINIDVYACGEIKSLTSSVGTVIATSDTKYVVTIPEGTREVTLSGVTDYSWLEDYGPRKVSTDKTIELKVDGAKCGYGVYTYYVEFKPISNIFAENDDPVADPVPAPVVPVENQETPTEENPYGTLLIDNITVKEAEIDFKNDVHEYEITIANEVSAINIEALSNNPDYTITISENAKDLKVGKNTVNVTITDPEGNTGLYTIIVDRLKPKSDNNFLASLKINGHVLNFDPSIVDYVVSLAKKEMMLTIDAIPESELASVEIIGNMNLVDGSIVTIRVTAENMTTKDYILRIEKKFNIMDYIYYIVAGVLVIVLIVLLLLIKKNKNKPKKAAPQTLEAQKETAGVIQEIGSQNSVEAAPVETPTLNASGAPAELKMIEPTNLETPTTSEEAKEEASTEVFSL